MGAHEEEGRKRKATRGAMALSTNKEKYDAKKSTKTTFTTGR